MKSPQQKFVFRTKVPAYWATATCLLLLCSLGSSAVLAQETESQSAELQSPKLPNEQLDSLVAPIALYSDPLLAQTLAASTYPLEIVQMQQWMDQNKDLKGKSLEEAVAKQNWDPSVQSMAATPEVLQRMSGNIAWTTDLGNAFLAQQSDVMDAVQRMRAKAEGKGTLQTNSQQKVETQTVEGGKQVITIHQSDPETVYVPSYDPQVVYGAPAYGYSYYPYTYPGYYAGMALSFGAGLAWGSYWGGHWGDCDWNGGDVNINNNNNFNRNNFNKNNIGNRTGNRTGNRVGQGNGKWQHNPQHRGNAPYGDRGTSNRFDQARRDGVANNRGNRGQGNRAGSRPGQGNIAGNRPGGGGAGRPGAGGSRPSTGRPGSGGGNLSGNRPGGGNRASTRPSNRASGAGGNRVGNRSVSSRPGGSSRGSAFGSSGGGFNGRSARASSSRGGRSMGGGGFSRGGGGGRRGGGGGRRGR